MTKLSEIKQSGRHWLGHVITVHEIAEYTIVEFERRDTKEILFDVYIFGHDIGFMYDSLDAALVAAIAYKRDGQNSQAANFFIKATDNGELSSAYKRLKRYAEAE